MRLLTTAFLCLIVPGLAAADPSQASFAPGLGISGVTGMIEVMPANQPDAPRRDMPYWIAMDNTLAAERVLQVEEIQFANGASCLREDCVLGWLAGHRVSIGERFVVMSGEEITSITLNRSDGTDFVHFARLEAPFSNCVDDDTTKELYAQRGWGFRGKRVAAVPLTDDPDELVVFCVR